MKPCKILLATLLAFLMFGCCSHIATPKHQHQYVDKLMDTTIALVIKADDDNYHPYCTGVWINQNTILTAAHCTRDEEGNNPVGRVLIFQTKEETKDLTNPAIQAISTIHYAVVVAANPEVDLALIKSVDLLPHPSAKISDQEAYQGDKLAIVGHTLGLPFGYVEGTISATRVMHGIKVIQVSTSAWKGNSGGAAFDSQGNIVGICSFLSNIAPNMVFFIHKSVIITFLEQELTQL